MTPYGTPGRGTPYGEKKRRVDALMEADTVKEAAEELGLNPKTLQSWARDNYQWYDEEFASTPTSQGPNPLLVPFLEANGPTPRCDAPTSYDYPLVRHKQEGVTLFDVTSTHQNSILNASHTEPVFYILGEHEPIEVLRVWLEANEGLVETEQQEKTLAFLVGDHGRSWKKAWRELNGTNRALDGSPNRRIED